MDKLIDMYGQPYNAISMADKEQVRRKKSVVVDLAKATTFLTKKDIEKWRSAWQRAIYHDYPSRQLLYDIYADVEIDNHLSAAIAQVNNSVLQRSFKIVDKKSGKKDEKATEILESEWFKDIMEMVLEARYWGHSLIQFGDVVHPTAGTIRLDGTELVPRKHVHPDFRVIIKDINDLPEEGIPYNKGRISRWVMEARYRNSLGIYLKAAPHCISKKNMIAFWDQFGELFGMPIRIAKTSNPDTREKNKVESMLREMGTAAWGLFPEGTEIEIKETSRQDAFEVYDQRIERANTEISKLILTVTMTLDNGSSRSQSEVHQDMLEKTIESQADKVRNVVNNTLMPKLAALGFPFLENHRFDWEHSLDYSPEQMSAVESTVLTHYNVKPEYFAERYGIPVTGEKQTQTPAGQQQKMALSHDEDDDFFF